MSWCLHCVVAFAVAIVHHLCLIQQPPRSVCYRRALVSKTAEALVLLQTLAANNLPRLAAAVDEGTRRTLRELTLRDLVYDPEGDRVAVELICVMVGEQQGAKNGNEDGLAAALASGGCGQALAPVDWTTVFS